MEKEATTYPIPPKHKCETCIHYLKNQECPAFWDKIPEDIWENKVEHDKVLDDQLLPLMYEFGNPII